MAVLVVPLAVQLTVLVLSVVLTGSSAQLLMGTLVCVRLPSKIQVRNTRDLRPAHDSTVHQPASERDGTRIWGPLTIRVRVDDSDWQAASSARIHLLSHGYHNLKVLRTNPQSQRKS